MIKLETARKLKAAGLTHTISPGDIYWQEKLDGTEGKYQLAKYVLDGFREDLVVTWIPGVEDILEAIEKEGYTWRMNSLRTISAYCIQSRPAHKLAWGEAFYNESLKEAVTAAYIWIKEQEAANEHS